MFKIALDAGHGMNTPGKRAPEDKMREFHFNKPLAEMMYKELQQYENVSVIMLHDGDGHRDVPLTARTNRANDWGADVLVSIHANALKGVWGNHTGIETFVYSTMPKTATELAKVVQSNLISATGFRNRGVKTANFHMLRETAMPAILIEHGFMDSRIDFPKLMSKDFRKLCAETNVQSLVQFYNLEKKAAQKIQSDDHLYRIIVNGTQVIALKDPVNIANQIVEQTSKGVKDIKLERVK